MIWSELTSKLFDIAEAVEYLHCHVSGERERRYEFLVTELNTADFLPGDCQKKKTPQGKGY